jgi:hypothetical protein
MIPVVIDPVSVPLLQVERHEWQRAEASLELARITRQPLRLCEALAELGRCERRSGQPENAADRFDEALRWARVVSSADLLADLLCERGELAADQAVDPDTPLADPEPDAWLMARACAAEAASLAALTSDPGWEVQVLLRASDLFHRLGIAGEAVALQTRAMERSGGTSPRRGTPPAATDELANPTVQ